MMTRQSSSSLNPTLDWIYSLTRTKLNLKGNKLMGLNPTLDWIYSLTSPRFAGSV